MCHSVTKRLPSNTINPLHSDLMLSQAQGLTQDDYLVPGDRHLIAQNRRPAVGAV